MNGWSNIEVCQQDNEIIEIDNFEKTLGLIPANALKIRELIARFEACHFKYQKHFYNIIESIKILNPIVDSEQIGLKHIHSGENAWRNDTTGRSLLGQQYLWALNDWLCNDLKKKTWIFITMN